MDLRTIERRIVVGSRFLSAIAVAGTLAGSLLMFALGAYNIVEAYVVAADFQAAAPGEFGTDAVISVIEGLDRFLIAIVLLYFAYGVYSLMIHPGEPESRLDLPEWLQVSQIGQLKQVVAEVIIVILLVLFLRLALQSFHGPDVELTARQIATIGLLPLSIALLALALRLVELHPKSPRGGHQGTAPERAAEAAGEDAARADDPARPPPGDADADD